MILKQKTTALKEKKPFLKGLKTGKSPWGKTKLKPFLKGLKTGKSPWENLNELNLNTIKIREFLI
jgi:hypothetical protein